MAILPLISFVIVQVATPGPANMTLFATGARYGFRRSVPFMIGVVLGKQILIWPLSYGLLGLLQAIPWLVIILKYLSAAYIVWLAWRIANMRLSAQKASDFVPGFLAGLIIHPFNPKAWAIITTLLTLFINPQDTVFYSTVVVSLTLLAAQGITHPLWVLAGDRIARLVAGYRGERYLFWGLAFLTVASVGYVLISGGGDRV